jgi:hypothetical protein
MYLKKPNESHAATSTTYDGQPKQSEVMRRKSNTVLIEIY